MNEKKNRKTVNKLIFINNTNTNTNTNTESSNINSDELSDELNNIIGTKKKVENKKILNNKIENIPDNKIENIPDNDIENIKDKDIENEFDVSKIYQDIYTSLSKYKFCKITGEIIKFKITDGNAWIDIKFKEYQVTGVFWKITNGKAPMASYDELLSDDQRWKLVNYIRELGKKGVVRIKKNNSQLIIHNCFACSQNKLLFILFGSK